MIIRILEFVCALLFSNATFSQLKNIPAQKWADKTYAKLSKDERIAQLMVVRLSTIDSKTKVITFYEDQVASLIKKYNVGGICVFQGSPVKQAQIINKLQSKAKTPIMMCIDAEWGVGMRLTDSVLPLPKQMMLGAMKDETIVYNYGKLVAEQCKRIGIQVNYAPVVDVNNNPNNPVINDRSFGEDKYKVAAFGIQYMKGMQDAGVMACAKHFPGHGDVTADSHYDLPVINKSMAELDSLELYPFRKIFDAGIGSVMLAHLYIPAIDKTANRATSLSPENINNLMRKQLNYNGLTFTDALEMQGVNKFYPNGEASVQSLIAGNDMLCLPGDVPLAIKKIKEAIKNKKLSWADIELHCKKVLMAKYQYGLSSWTPINTDNITNDLNNGISAMRRQVAENAITLVSKKDERFFPLRDTKPGDIAFVGFGITADNEFAKRMKTDYNATIFFATENDLINKLKKFKKVVVGIHNVGRFAASNFGFSKTNIDLLNTIQQNYNCISFLFGNAYALKNMCNAPNMVMCYEDDAIVQGTAVDLLQGKIFYKGTLPVTVCENLKYGFGVETKATVAMFEKKKNSSEQNINLLKIDSIANDAIAKKAMPGAVILALKNGEIVYDKAFGSYTYDNSTSVTMQTVYDMASVTKICATTLAVMKLFDEGKLDLKKKLSDYLPEMMGTNKQNISVENLLLHQAGLVPYIPFYKEVIDSFGKPLPTVFSNTLNDTFGIKVADNLYMKNAWKDTMYKRIILSPVGPTGKYVYSDNDFILLAKIVEKITSKSIDEYVLDNFYTPMNLNSIGYDPLLRNCKTNIAPTENEKIFRTQLIQSYVHDPGAAMMGGIAGHAGLFSNAYDLAAIMQMLLNGGEFKGKNLLKKETIELFTTYHSSTSRRGYGFDKPEKDNATRAEPYPALAVSPLTFGHTGFTGTCVWADPAAKLVYIFLSNRVYPDVSTLLLKMNVRVKIFDTLIETFAN
ncbi:MAG: glycoside hydrolase family 3 N-terminal domain-containing protein [Ferruginibacter sp.]|nr:serine hydrolase [Ferruginibacter sp.]